MSRSTALLCLPVFAAMLGAQEARSIVEEAQRRTRAESQRYEGTLEVIGNRGRIATKRWRYERLGSHGSSKAVLRFTAPPEVKGVALLIHNHPDRASDQWMWTPALQRERRIALQDRSTRFFGTDFSFEDLEERDVDQFDFRLLGEEQLEGAACWKIEASPKKTRASQYTRSLLWIRKDNYAWAQMEGYKGQRLIRRVRYLDLQPVQGIWTARRLEVTDFTRNSRTVLRLDKLEYNVKLSDDEFTLQALRRES